MDVDRARGVAEGLPLSLFEYQEPGPEPVERVRVLERAARFVPSPPAGGWQARHFAVVGILSRVRPTVLPGETVGAVFERERKNYNRLMANQTVTSD